jgi:hypothetical protein
MSGSLAVSTACTVTYQYRWLTGNNGTCTTTRNYPNPKAPETYGSGTLTRTRTKDPRYQEVGNIFRN